MKKLLHGFTIIELLVATTVFSVVMVLCLSAFLRVGQLYYKGIFLSRTQEAARNISDDIVNQLRLNGNPADLLKSTTPIRGHDVYYMCAGTKRYSFMSNNVVNTQNESNTNFGLVSDNVAAAGGCNDPAAANLSNPTELLGDKMRIVATNPNQSDLSITCATAIPKLACVHVHIDFGDDDLLINPANNSDFTNPPPLSQVSGGTCSGPLQGSQFCATTDLDTTIYSL